MSESDRTDVIHQAAGSDILQDVKTIPSESTTATPIVDVVDDDSDIPANAKRIGLWGGRSAGKTTYLIMLHRQYGIQEGNASSRARTNTLRTPRSSSPPIYVRATETQNTRYRLEDIYHRTLQTYKFPDSTRATDYNINSRYILHLLRDGKTFWLDYEDLPGEIIQIPTLADHAEKQSEAYQKLAKNHGLLWMLDPDDSVFYNPGGLDLAKIQAGLDAFVNAYARVKNVSAEISSIPIPIAFCIPKIDGPQHWLHRHKPADYAEILWPGIHQMIEGRVKSFQWYALTALGVSESHGLTRSNVYRRYNQDTKSWTQHIRQGAQFKPTGLVEPLIWLIDQFSNS